MHTRKRNKVKICRQSPGGVAEPNKVLFLIWGFIQKLVESYERVPIQALS